MSPITGGTPTTEGSKPRAKRWYRFVKNSKRVETDGGESERPVVSLKRGNHPRDPVERRGRHVMTPLEGNTAGASKPVDVSTKQQRIAELAQQSPEMGFTSLAYLVDLRWMLEAFHRTRKDGAVGVRRTGWRGLCREPGGQPSVAAKPSQVRHVPRSARAAGTHSEGRLNDRDSAAGNSDLRG